MLEAELPGGRQAGRAGPSGQVHGGAGRRRLPVPLSPGSDPRVPRVWASVATRAPRPEDRDGALRPHLAPEHAPRRHGPEPSGREGKGVRGAGFLRPLLLGGPAGGPRAGSGPPGVKASPSLRAAQRELRAGPWVSAPVTPVSSPKPKPAPRGARRTALCPQQRTGARAGSRPKPRRCGSARGGHAAGVFLRPRRGGRVSPAQQRRLRALAPGPPGSGSSRHVERFVPRRRASAIRLSAAPASIAPSGRRRAGGRAPRRGHRLTPADDELYQRTHISLLQRDAPHAAYVESYSSRGFVVNGNRVFGPCALLPHSVLQWNVGSHLDITEESFSLFWMLEPPLEIVVVGTGDRTERLPSRVLRALRQRGLAVEVQDTPNACATFNFLCHEGRATGAALIPPPGGTALAPLAQAAE